jgi:hypothetical protein
MTIDEWGSEVSGHLIRKFVIRHFREPVASQNLHAQKEAARPGKLGRAAFSGGIERY